MNKYTGQKFIASYSSGKDSTLAIYKAVQEGMEPLGLIMTYNTDREISWFHGIKPGVIKKLENSLALPITLIRTGGEDYEKNFENELIRKKEEGARICVFGDIDLAEHLDWCTRRCEHSGLSAYFPMWHNNRRDVVSEFIRSGFTTYITVVDTERMHSSYLGKVLSEELVASMEADGIDACGENGEFHTFVTNGPLFKSPLDIRFSDPVPRGKYLTLEIE
ncbi:diphthine--ammonia ligase [Ruminococcus sp. OA3]|uniref:Dph6-related ATP pyrophosphatase n=1 Tax=Ruminococcus sp. OA3 TaxID=2914164 RepID=UPI001F062DBF|nr:diphthine--ammonia ligase [Ruminococcus sp. OA3]